VLVSVSVLKLVSASVLGFRHAVPYHGPGLEHARPPRSGLL